MEKFYVPTRSVCAAVVLWFAKNQKKIDFRGGSTMNVMVDKIIELKHKHGLDTTHVSIRDDIGGRWKSDDLVGFPGVGTGSPTEEALNDCREIIREDHKECPDGIEKLVMATGLEFLD